MKKLVLLIFSSCLNPCFNGRWSARSLGNKLSMDSVDVLILVLMEDGLRALRKRS